MPGISKEDFLQRMRDKASKATEGPKTDGGDAVSEGEGAAENSDLKQCIADMKSLMARMERYG